MCIYICIYVCMYVCIKRYVYACVYLYISMYVSAPVGVCTCGVLVWVRVCVLCVCDSPSSFCVWWCVTAFQTRSNDPNPVTGD